MTLRSGSEPERRAPVERTRRGRRARATPSAKGAPRGPASSQEAAEVKLRPLQLAHLVSPVGQHGTSLGGPLFKLNTSSCSGCVAKSGAESLVIPHPTEQDGEPQDGALGEVIAPLFPEGFKTTGIRRTDRVSPQGLIKH